MCCLPSGAPFEQLLGEDNCVFADRKMHYVGPERLHPIYIFQYSVCAVCYLFHFSNMMDSNLIYYFRSAYCSKEAETTGDTKA